mgnify:FL=1
MDCILIVSGSEKGRAKLQELLAMDPSSGETIFVRNGKQARLFLIERDCDLCVINAPLSDEFGTDLAVHIAGKGISQVLLIVRNELADEISEKVEKFGVFVIPRPVSPPFFWSAYKLITAAHNRMLTLQSENQQLQNRIEDMKRIDRAKCLLVQFLNITEPEAHRFIEKQAMDRRVTKKEIAGAILKKYEG